MGDGVPLKGVRSEHLADKLILPNHFNPSAFGAAGAISVIDPDDPAAAGATGLLADAGHQHPWTTAAPASLARTSSNTEGVATQGARADHSHSTANMAWGRIADQELATNSTGFTGNATTDFSLAGVVVDVTRFYVVHLSSLINRSANGDWQINVHVGGTLMNEIGRVGDNATGTNKFEMAVPWKPASGTFTVDLRVVEVGGAATLTFFGGANATRWFWITDEGPRT